MGLLSWLRKVSAPWLGTWRDSEAAATRIGTDEVRKRLIGQLGKIRFMPWLDSVTGETAAHRAVYRQAFKEPAVKSAILDKVLGVAALDLAVNPGGENPPDQAASDFGLHLVNRIGCGEQGSTLGVVKIVEAVIIPGLIDGYSIAEPVWGPETRGKWNGKVLMKKLKTKDPDRDVQLEVDEANNVVSLTGIGVNAGKSYDPRQFILWRHLSIFDNPGGMSDLRAAVRGIWCIDTATKLHLIYLEKYSAGPMLMGTYTDPGQQKQELESALEAAKGSTWMSVPDGARAEALDLAVRGTGDFEKAIELYRRDIFLAIAGAALQALEGTTTDGRGNSEVHRETANTRAWYLQRAVEGIINEQILPDATDLNFAGAALPTANLGGVDDTEMKAALEIDKMLLVDMGMPLDAKDTYKRAGRTMPPGTPEIIKPPDRQPLFAPHGEHGRNGMQRGAVFTDGDDDLDQFCGGKGGNPGPCPEGDGKSGVGGGTGDKSYANLRQGPDGRAAQIGAYQRNANRQALVGLRNGTLTSAQATEQIHQAMVAADKAAYHNMSNRYNLLKQDAVKAYGPDVVNTPQWREVRQAFRDGADNSREAVQQMNGAARFGMSYPNAARLPGMLRDAEQEHHRVGVETRDRVLKAMQALKASHPAQHAETAEMMAEELSYWMPASGVPAKPFCEQGRGDGPHVSSWGYAFGRDD